jgi:ABC-type polysaccharide/polyol phosphate export permease
MAVYMGPFETKNILSIYFYFISILLLLVGLGFELSALCLQSRHFYHLSHTSSTVWSGYFGDEGLWNYFPG